jgi:hypothetical protein
VKPEQATLGPGAAGLTQPFGGPRIVRVAAFGQREVTQKTCAVKQARDQPGAGRGQLPSSSVEDAGASSSRRR